MSVTVYSKSGCPQCVFTKKFLDSEKITFEEKRVDLNEEYLKEVIDLGYQSLPVVKTSDGETFNGYHEEKLAKLVTEWQR